jgi:hypothetical protein
MASHLPPPDDSDRPACRSRRHEPGTAPPQARDLYVCGECREVLEEILIELPVLFDLCADALDARSDCSPGQIDEPWPLGIDMGETGGSVRSEILSALIAWSWFVISERGVSGPGEFAARKLVGFLAVHLHWLCQHQAAAALVDELTDLTAAVSTALRHNTSHRAAMGTCPQPGCGATVYAEAQREGAEPYEIACEAGHVWAPAGWLSLLRGEPPDNENANANGDAGDGGEDGRAPRTETAE